MHQTIASMKTECSFYMSQKTVKSRTEHQTLIPLVCFSFPSPLAPFVSSPSGPCPCARRSCWSSGRCRRCTETPADRPGPSAGTRTSRESGPRRFWRPPTPPPDKLHKNNAQSEKTDPVQSLVWSQWLCSHLKNSEKCVCEEVCGASANVRQVLQEAQFVLEVFLLTIWAVYFSLYNPKTNTLWTLQIKTTTQAFLQLVNKARGRVPPTLGLLQALYRSQLELYSVLSAANRRHTHTT